ncbi:uncharacterized protein [Neodiprion pinetum]|uniref:uncharacterized protein n=1 Tax=Neodiprion pinetum TaxID=441929 RepID=UPI0037145999
MVKVKKKVQPKVVIGGRWRWSEVDEEEDEEDEENKVDEEDEDLCSYSKYNSRWLEVVELDEEDEDLCSYSRYNSRWLEVVELDEVEDEDSCSFCVPPSDPLVHILRRDIAVLRIKKKRFMKMQIAPLFLPLCFQPLLWCVFKIKESI